MKLSVQPSSLKGEAIIPGSKSNTTRAVLIASLANGTSTIRNPLPSADCLSTVAVCRSLGAKIQLGENWQITGVGSRPAVPEEILDVGNSGTTFYMTCGVAGLVNGYSIITGDFQLRRRPAGPLI
ncbi:MAG: 3-phosphoshikimate 1-carboxyvinyltransferase, partial [Proteobacteria bacterium]|nr:3-phosphoshikimate 1-carboxyvinyltransferase [Pseudomonadota bacterium]